MAQLLHPGPVEFHIAEDADTIEMELTAEQLFALSQAAAVSQAPLAAVAVPAPISVPVPVSVHAPGPVQIPATQELLPNLLPLPQTQVHSADMPTAGRRGMRVAVAIGIAAASVVAGVMGYLATPRAPPAAVAAAPAPRPVAPEPPPPPPPAEDPPVQFRNPFDAKEVFEFPAGTSATDARAAVADLLLQRAQERLGSSPGAKGPGSKPAGPVAPTGPATMDDHSLQAVLTPPSTGRR